MKLVATHHNQKSRTAFIAGAVSLAFMVGFAQPASADDQGAAAADSVEDVVSSTAPAVDVVGGVVSATGEISAVGDDATTTAPVDGNGDVVVVGESGVSVTLGLPAVVDDASAVIADGGSVVYADPEGLTDVVVQPLDAGVRVQVIINSEDSPTSYSYPLDPSITPVLNADGSVDLFLNGDGFSYGAGHIDAPWALDANGAAIPTNFVVTDGQLSQVVNHIGVGAAYPVVADPAFQADCGIVTCTLRFDRARTHWLASHPSERDLILALGCLTIGAVTEVIGGVICGVIAAVIVYHANKAAEYYKQGKCYSYRFVATSPALGVASAVTRYTYNCR